MYLLKRKHTISFSNSRYIRKIVYSNATPLTQVINNLKTSCSFPFEEKYPYWNTWRKQIYPHISWDWTVNRNNQTNPICETDKNNQSNSSIWISHKAWLWFHILILLIFRLTKPSHGYYCMLCSYYIQPSQHHNHYTIIISSYLARRPVHLTP